MKKILNIILAALLSVPNAFAFDACIDDIYYNFSGDEATVTYCDNGGNSYSGTIVIPEFVGVDEKTYRVTGIGEDAFLNCSNLNAITIPNYLTHIAGGAFFGCRGLTAVHVKDLEVWCKITFDGPQSNPLSYAKHLYMTGQEITDLTIPGSITTINNYAFEGCTDLKTIVFPRSVTSIGQNAFSNCASLTDVYCYADDVPEAVSGAFPYASLKSATLHVPAGSVEAYKAQSPWSRFGSIVALAEPVSFTEGQMATIILPVAPEAEKGKYYRLDRVEDGQIIFEQELQPRAHVPYIIVPSEDFSIDLSTLDLQGLQSDTVSIEGISFIGSFVNMELPALTGGEGGESFYIDIIDATPDCGFTEETKAFIGALRAWLQVSWNDPYDHGGSRSPGEKMGIVLHDYGTGLRTIQNSKCIMQNEVYDLSGRKIANGKSSNLQISRGIYIENGQKRAR